ncbi:MAG TPA: hypothetical protein VKW78_12065 [Terriglobales bacterium]|nr:hypothetical protein [Terriglobales bacterium]
MAKRLFPLAFGLLFLSGSLFAAQPVQVQLSTSGVAPREVEDNTEKAIIRDYQRAWQSLAAALSENRTDLLANDFIGYAQDELHRRVAEQQNSGLHTRFIDHGHSLKAIMYSQDGSAMQLRDTAQIEVQQLDGNSVIHSDQITQSYLVVMTAGENRWKVRILQALPSEQ